MKSIIQGHSGENANGRVAGASPEAFAKIARKLLERLREVTGPNEMRALAVDKAASPLMQVCEVDSSSLYFSYIYTAIFGARSKVGRVRQVQ